MRCAAKRPCKCSREAASGGRQHAFESGYSVYEFSSEPNQLRSQTRWKIDVAFVFGRVAPAMTVIEHASFFGWPADRMFEALKDEVTIVAPISVSP